jgi:hypothetical protein
MTNWVFKGNNIPDGIEIYAMLPFAIVEEVNDFRQKQFFG